MKKIAFIVNPISGVKSSKSKFRILEKFVSDNNHELFVTEYPGHAQKLAAVLKNEFEILGVFGGDGTINEVAFEIIQSDTVLAIIPAGSGNGLAYHFKIPIGTDEALGLLTKPARLVDTIRINDKLITNVGGIGFDGHVAKLFNESASRGLFTYAKLIITQLIKFKEQKFEVEINGSNQKGSAFMIAFANGSEFGNRFHIDPLADATDGEFSLIIVRKPPYLKLIPLLIDGFKGNLKESKYYKRYPATELSISSPGADLHRDGEVSDEDSVDHLKLKILPGSLQLIY
jgi:diacylglycerol kinase family enzyme